MSDPPPLRLFLDRSTQGRRFVEAVRQLVPDTQTINDRYGMREAEEVPDSRWIEDATTDGRILVGADRYVLRNPLERRTVCRTGARYVVFGTNNLRAARMIELFAENLPRIEHLTALPGPWVHRIAQHGLETAAAELRRRLTGGEASEQRLVARLGDLALRPSHRAGQRRPRRP